MFNLKLSLLLFLSLFLIGCQEFGAPGDIRFNIVRNDERPVEVKLMGANLAHGPIVAFGPLVRPTIKSEDEHFNLTFFMDDPDNNINKVELYDNGKLLATDVTLPFSFNTNLLEANGSYVLEAKIFDSTGLNSKGPTVFLSISISTSGGNPGDMKKIPIRLGDRHYVGSILEDIFGKASPTWNFQGKSSTAAVVNEITNLPTNPIRVLIEDIITDVSSFGGACDLNTRVRLERTSFEEFRREKCNGSNFDVITNLKRDSKIMGICDTLSKNDLAIRNVVSKVSGNISIPPTATQTQAIFELFYPNLTYDSDLKSSIDNIMATKSSVLEKWRVLVNGICQTAYWQVID